MNIDKIEEYSKELRELVKERTSKDCEPWLFPQIEAAAINRALLMKVASELLSLDTLMQESRGYNDQTKFDAHPLLTHLDKLQRTLLMQYEALGLNYKTTPSKVKEDTRKGVSESDGLMQIMKGTKASLDSLENFDEP